MFRLFLIAAVLFATAAFSFAQTAPTPKKTVVAPTNAAVKSSPAYAEVLLRKTERESELEELRVDFTEEFPKVKELKFELDLLNKQLEKLAATNATDAGKLSLALGKLMVRKIELETDLWNLRQKYKDEDSEVKRARRKIEIFEQAIKEIF